MKNLNPLIGFVALLLAATSPAHAEDTLWNLTFKDLKPGDTPKEVPYAAPCSGPQKVVTDAQNTLVGAKALGTLTTPLVFTKGSSTSYTPTLTLKAETPFTTGVVTVKFDIYFDSVSPAADHPVATLMAFPFINDKNGSDFILVIVCNGPGNLVLAGSNLKKGTTPAAFKTGEVAHIKAVLDLNAHTFQAFVNDTPMADAEKDDVKFSTFLGFTARDGTALGGNKGETFTSGLSNLVITHS
jgi:hypothetical protein